MTILQTIAIFAIGVIAELLIFLVVKFFSDMGDEVQMCLGLVFLLNTLAIIGVLLTWANGVKFPLK